MSIGSNCHLNEKAGTFCNSIQRKTMTVLWSSQCGVLHMLVNYKSHNPWLSIMLTGVDQKLSPQVSQVSQVWPSWCMGMIMVNTVQFNMLFMVSMVNGRLCLDLYFKLANIKSWCNCCCFLNYIASTWRLRSIKSFLGWSKWIWKV